MTDVPPKVIDIISPHQYFVGVALQGWLTKFASANGKTDDIAHAVQVAIKTANEVMKYYK